MTDPLIARLRALLVEWRQRARYSSHFADWHPRAAQDVKDAALGEGFAFGACADELAAILVDLDAAPLDLDRASIRTGCETETNRQADAELKRLGYTFDPNQQRWLKATEPVIISGNQGGSYTSFLCSPINGWTTSIDYDSDTSDRIVVPETWRQKWRRAYETWRTRKRVRRTLKRAAEEVGASIERVASERLRAERAVSEFSDTKE